MRMLPSRFPSRCRRRAPSFWTGCALALFFLAAPCLGLQGPARAETVVQLEAENMVASHNVGGGAIGYVSCGAARGGLAVDGVDTPGDYIEWPLTLAQDFVFRDSLRTAGSIGVVRQFAILFLPSGGGPPVAADTLITLPGAGIG